jgi:hypothetical protein
MPAPEYTMSEEVPVGVVGLTVAVGVGVSTGVSSLIQPANITAVAIATIAIIPKIFFLPILFSPFFDMQYKTIRYKKVNGFFTIKL